MNQVYSFEDGIPKNIEFNGTISISNRHFKDGEASLKWDIEEKGELALHTPILYENYNPNGVSKAISTFVFWVYQEKAITEKMRVSFYKNDTEQCYFEMGMDFTGWRTVWVPFENMQGKPVENMDKLVLTLYNCNNHTLYLDQIIPMVKIDPRHQVRDIQVPFVNLNADKVANSHWMSVYRFWKLYEEEIGTAKDFVISKEDKDTFDLIGKRFERVLMAHNPYPSIGKTQLTWEEISDLQSEYKMFRLKEENGTLTGATINSRFHEAAYPQEEKEILQKRTNALDITFASKWAIKAAYMWNVATDTQKEVIEKLYVTLMRHLIDQGWDIGSGMGTVHHLGYPMRNYYKSIYLMREPLKKYGLLQRVSDIAKWFSGVGRMLRSSEEIVGESLDVFNTLSAGMVISILTEENLCKKYLLLEKLKYWLDVALKPAPGLEACLKIDGSTYHHVKHYPAYTLGGFEGIAPIVYMLSKTKYAIGAEGHNLLRKALFVMRFYCNHSTWPVAMSARHPVGDGDRGSISTLEPFYYMALAGTPNSDEKYDGKMVGVLLRLAKYKKFPPAEKFLQEGYQAEQTPNGNVALSYGASTLHRRGEWLASVCGHSRYIWGNETYVANNLYGRYVAYGNLQILGKGSPIDAKHSGYVQEGWDWNFWPGTTTVALPLKELRSRVCNVDRFSGFEEMLISDQKFVGGITSKGENGVFAMKLHSHAKYDATQRANKSYFFFGNKIICMGTGIQNENQNGNTYTTLFQNYLMQDSDAVYVDHVAKKALNYTETFYDAHYLYDNCGNGYYIPSNQKVTVTRLLQTSFDQNTDEETSNLFAKALLEHGCTPKDASYQYCVFPSQAQFEKVPSQEDMDKLYKVYCMNDSLHCVYDVESNTYAYVFWDCDVVTEYAKVMGVSSPMLVMEKADQEHLTLSLCDPDLRLYEGQEEDQLDENGLQKEVSLYSRKWLSASSIPKQISVTLRGKWELQKKNQNSVKVEIKGNETVVTAISTDGLTYEVELEEMK